MDSRRGRKLLLTAVTRAVTPALHRDEVAVLAKHLVHYLSDGGRSYEGQKCRVALEKRGNVPRPIAVRNEAGRLNPVADSWVRREFGEVSRSAQRARATIRPNIRPRVATILMRQRHVAPKLFTQLQGELGVDHGLQKRASVRPQRSADGVGCWLTVRQALRVGRGVQQEILGCIDRGCRQWLGAKLCVQLPQPP